MAIRSLIHKIIVIIATSEGLDQTTLESALFLQFFWLATQNVFKILEQILYMRFKVPREESSVQKISLLSHSYMNIFAKLQPLRIMI